MNSALFPDLIVNGEKVPHTIVAAETQNHEAPKNKPGLAWRRAANAVAIRTLLLQEAKARSITPERQEVSPGRFETDEEALIRGLLETEINVPAPSEQEIRAEWEKAPERFKSPPLWEVSHILCACDPRDETAREKARARANKLLRMALADPKCFPALAAQESDCDSKKAGGSLGQLGPNDTVPEFEAALPCLKEGEIAAKPVLTRHGYHIIRMDAVAKGKQLPFDAVRGNVAVAIEKVNWVKQSRDFIAKLVEGSEIQGAALKAKLSET